ncbi:MAG: PAS domain S-box protein [Hylemonella sp.]|nr:PAS domain S-box protein [Hylemonella sp.]
MKPKSMSQGNENSAALAGMDPELKQQLQVLNDAPCLVLLLDAEGCVRYVNAYFEKTTSYRCEEIQGQDWLSALLPDAEQERQRSRIQDVKAGEAKPQDSSVLRTRSGELQEIEWHDSQLHDSRGRFIGVLRIGQDRTERQRLAYAVELSNKRLNEAQRIAKVGSWELDLATGHLYWTDEIFRLFEIDQQKFGATYEAFLNAIHPDDRDAVNQAYSRSLTDRLPYQIVHRLRMPDGRVKYVEERCKSDFDHKGQALRSVGTVQDITTQHQIEQALRQSEIFFKSVFDNAAVGMMLVENGCVARVNQAFVRLLDYTPQELRNMKNEVFRTITHSEDFEQTRQLEAELLEGKREQYQFEKRYIRKDGEAIWVMASGTIIRDELGDAVNVIVQAVDITAQKRSEEAVRGLNAALEQRVLQRTAQLKSANDELLSSLEKLNQAQTHLVRSEKMAALGGLVAGVAHEINTPLGIGITAASHLDEKIRKLAGRYKSNTLSRDELTDFLAVAEESARMVMSNLERAAELIRSFKQVAVDQTGGMPRRFYLRDYLQEVVRSLRPELDKTAHQIRISCAAEIELLGRPGDYSQIITNLVMNSLTHGFDGIRAGNIAIVAKRLGRNLVLRYSDDGRGIDGEHLGKIFDPFYTTRRGQGGSGLGLHVLYNIVTQGLNGYVSCVSSPGCGAVFEIEVPQVFEEEPLEAETLPGVL